MVASASDIFSLTNFSESPCSCEAVTVASSLLSASFRATSWQSPSWRQLLVLLLRVEHAILVAGVFFDFGVLELAVLVLSHPWSCVLVRLGLFQILVL